MAHGDADVVEAFEKPLLGRGVEGERLADAECGYLEQQTFQATTQVKYMTDALTAEKGIFWVNPKTWQETAENAVATGAAKAVPKFDDLLTTDILEKVQPPKH